ncbi:MAG: hypothetical protein K0Q51_482 [Rickettsiaceae bacterium]|nr:hypothetical protein [Rickettsiaceae bacterium]
MKKLLASFNIILLTLSACYYPVQTFKQTNEINHSQHLITKPIYFIIKSDGGIKSSAYFLLYYNINNNKYFMKLRWQLFAKQRPYIHIRNSLQLNLDDQVEFLLSAVRPPKITKISLEPYGIEEEALYEVDRPTLEIIAQAGKVDLEIRSRIGKLKGFFIKKHSFNAFAEFLDTVDKEINEE